MNSPPTPIRGRSPAGQRRLGPVDFDRLATLVDGGCGVNDVAENVLGRLIDAYGVAGLLEMLREPRRRGHEPLRRLAARARESRAFVDVWRFQYWEMPAPGRAIAVPARPEAGLTSYDLWTAGGYQPAPCIEACIWRPEQFARPVLAHRYVNARGRVIAWSFFVPTRSNGVPGVERVDRLVPYGVWGTEDHGAFRFGTVIHVRWDETVIVGATNPRGALDSLWADCTGGGLIDVAWTCTGPQPQKGERRLPLLARWTNVQRADALRVRSSLECSAEMPSGT